MLVNVYDSQMSMARQLGSDKAMSAGQDDGRSPPDNVHGRT